MYLLNLRCCLECESNLNLLGQFKDLVDGMHSKMSDLSTTVPRDEFSTLTSDLDSLKSTITEIEVVKNCDFIEEEASSITGTSFISRTLNDSLEKTFDL